MWQLGTWLVYFYTPQWSDGQLISHPLAIVCFSVSELICILVRLRQGQFCCQISCASKHTPLYSVSCLQCSSPTQRVWIEIWIMALFSNQRYELRPEALVPTHSQVVSIKSSVGLSNLKYYTSMWSVKGVRIAFQVYFAFGGYGWSWKGSSFVSAPHNLPSFFLHVFFLPVGCLLA